MTSESNKEVRAKLEELKTKYDFCEPDRGDLDNPNTVWRSGKPDYTKANYQYLCGKTQNHKPGKKARNEWARPRYFEISAFLHKLISFLNGVVTIPVVAISATACSASRFCFTDVSRRMLPDKI